MQRISFFLKHFLKEPLWFKVLVVSALVISIVFSSSFFSNNIFYYSISKLAAAVFFFAYGIKLRSNVKIAVLFFVIAGICIYISGFPLLL